MAGTERWPPVYDAQELSELIGELGARTDLEAVIYQSNVVAGGPCCQGDVLQLHQGVPLIDEAGEPRVSGDFSHWLVVGNTCDFERADVEWTQVVPIQEWPHATPERVQVLTTYGPSREFYIPYWAAKREGHILVADFVRPCALSKKAIGPRATVVARMSRAGWILLHACLVRFLARDDGRFD